MFVEIATDILHSCVSLVCKLFIPSNFMEEMFDFDDNSGGEHPNLIVFE